jgi:DNA-binding NtrC family response regulator
LVEDESFVRNVTAEVLNSAGYRVLAAANASQALELFRECRGHVDLLLTDVCLPGKSGQALARRLEAACPNLKIIFTSGYGDFHAAEESDRVFYLPKPFAIQKLIRTVAEVLAHDAREADLSPKALRALAT